MQGERSVSQVTTIKDFTISLVQSHYVSDRPDVLHIKRTSGDSIPLTPTHISLWNDRLNEFYIKDSIH